MEGPNGLEQFFRGKTAGMPNSVWIIVLGGAIGWGIYRRKHSTATVDSTAGSASDGSTTIAGQAPAEFLPINPPSNSGQANPNGGFASNVDWETACLKWVAANTNYAAIAAGHPNPPENPSGTNPVSATKAINDYLAGNALFKWEADVVNRLIANVGPPPFAPSGDHVGTILDPPVTAPLPVPIPLPHPSPSPPPPPPPPAPAPPPRQQRTYTVVRGDNLTAIGRKFGVSWQAIYNANRNKIKNPNLIYPGQVFIIP